MTKKLLSVILSVLLIVSAFGMSSAFASENETEILGPEVEDKNLPEVAEGCNRYFFYLPDSWKNEFSQTAGIYWWEGTGAQSSWPGVEAHKADAENVYYYDVPKDVEKIIWNNYIHHSPDQMVGPEYYATKYTHEINVDEYMIFDEMFDFKGYGNYDGYIYVTREKCFCDDYPECKKTSGYWYYYYGNGKYARTTSDGETEISTENVIINYGGYQRPHIKGYNRFFFYMPDEWYNESATKGPGIYWNTETSSSDDFPGTPLKPADVEGLYYCDVPASVDEFWWTNLFDGGEDFSDPTFCDELRASSRPYDADEDFSLQDCNGMVFVVDFAYFDFDVDLGKMVCHGKWFEYYGYGEYGTEYVRGDGEIYTDKAFNGSTPEPIVLPYYIGDADKNGKVNVKDATAIQKHLVNIDKCSTIAGDVDGSGVMNIKDATVIQKYVAGIDTGYPVGKIGYA